MKLHLKGYLLQRLSRRSDDWDTRLVGEVLAEYGLQGLHWCNNLHIALDELASGGLIEPLEARLMDGQLQFRYRLTDFGRQRMADTGLLTEAA